MECCLVADTPTVQSHQIICHHHHYITHGKKHADYHHKDDETRRHRAGRAMTKDLDNILKVTIMVH
jgi:hypothetical protein